MIYDFHEGDYVKIKYIDTPTYLTKEFMTERTNLNDSEYINLCMADGNTYTGTERDISSIFERIGKYDFTQKQEIEPLQYYKVTKKLCSQVIIKAEDYPNSNPDFKKDMCNVIMQTSIQEIIGKINEIIAYINSNGKGE